MQGGALLLREVVILIDYSLKEVRLGSSRPGTGTGTAHECSSHRKHLRVNTRPTENRLYVGVGGGGRATILFPKQTKKANV